MAFAFRTAFAVGVATVGAGATLMSTMNPPCYHQPDSDSLVSRDRFNQRPRVTLQSVWDPDTAAHTPSQAPSPSPTTSAPSPARRRMLEYSRSEDERSAYTAQTDFSTSDPGTITPFSRPPSVFGSLTVEQLLRQRQELESSVSLLQEESQRLRISNSDMEQNAAGLVGYLEQLRSQREEAIAEHNGIQEQLGRDLQSLQTELNDTCTARNAARGQLDDIRTAFGAAQDELREAHERISQAKETLANLVSERDAAKSQLDTISHSRDRVSLELAERKAELHQTTESSQQEHRRLDGLRHESATLASSFEQARSEHASIMRRIQGEEKDALARLSTLRTTTEKEAKSRTLAVTEQERRERQALEALRSETSEAQRLHKTDLTRMQTETKDAQASIAKVQTELRTAKTSLTEQKRLHVKAVADLDVITAQRGKVEQEARTAAEEAAQAKDAALLARQELGRLNTAIQEGTARLARVTTSGSQERVHTPATPIALSVPQGADSFSQAQQTSYHGAHGRASADRSEMDHRETDGHEDSSPATKGFWGNVVPAKLWNALGPATQALAGPPPMPQVPETRPVLRNTGSRLLADTRTGQERGGMATPPTSPNTQKTGFPARQPSSAGLPTTQIDVLNTTAIQGPTPPMTAIDPPPALPAAAHPEQAPVTSEGLRSPLPVGPTTSVADPPSDPRASKQHSSEIDAALPPLEVTSLAQTSAGKSLPAISAVEALNETDGGEVSNHTTAVFSGLDELDAWTGSPSAPSKGDALSKQDDMSVGTTDQTEDPTGTTDGTTNERTPVSKEVPLPLVEVKEPEDEPPTADALPAPSEDTTSTPAVPPVASANLQADSATTNDAYDKTALELVEKTTLVVDGKTALELADMIVEALAPPYQPYPDDVVISFTPGAKLWPVVMLEVILPSAYSKAPSDLDQGVASPKGSKTRP